MKNDLSQQGASIVEMLIVATILLIFVTGVMGLMMRSGSGFSIKLEKNKVEEDKEVLGNLIKPDFENAGIGIASYSNHTYGTAAANFVSNPNYLASGDGKLVRLEQNPGGDENSNGTIRSSTVLGSETGSVTVKMNLGSYIRLTGEDRSEITLQIGTGVSRNYKVYAIVDGETTEIGDHTPGTTYRIGLTPDPAGKAVVISRLDENSQPVVLFRNNRGIPQGKISVSAYIAKAGDYMQVKMTGAPLIDTRKTDSLQTALFVDDRLGEKVPGSVYENKIQKTVTILGGDSRTGISFLQQPVTDLNGQTTIYVTKPQKGSYNRSDYGLIVDYSRGTSVLVEIADVTDLDLNNQAIVIIPVVSGNRAWDRFYSTDDSLSGTYAAGSKFLKLAVPVTYGVTEDRLVREVNGRHETVAFNVRGFNFSEEMTKNGPTYRIEVQLAADGRATDREGTVPQVSYVYTATPRALNAANQSE